MNIAFNWGDSGGYNWVNLPLKTNSEKENLISRISKIINMKANKFRSKKSLQKRIKILAKGLLKCHHAGNAHRASHKTNQQKKRLRDSFFVSKSDVNRLKKIIGTKKTKINNNLPKV